MISEKATSMLHTFVDKYQKTGVNHFDISDYASAENYEKLLIELDNAGLIVYDDSHVADFATLTSSGHSSQVLIFQGRIVIGCCP